MAGQVALVTGAARGIGRAIAAELSREGYALCVNYLRSAEAAETLTTELNTIGGRAVALRADVSDSGEAAALLARTEEALGPVTLLVNNAGIAGQTLFQDVSDEEWARFLAVNLTGPRNMIRSVLPGMIHRKNGCIVNIASIWGLQGASCEAAYACTKAGVVSLTRSLALELGPSGIRVNCVAPGVIDTEMVRPLGTNTLRSLAEATPLGRLGTPEDVAHAVAFLASDRAAFLTGQILTVDGGFTL